MHGVYLQVSYVCSSAFIEQQKRMRNNITSLYYYMTYHVIDSINNYFMYKFCVSDIKRC